MDTKEVTLGKIAVASLLFNSLTPYNASLAKFREATKRRLDLASEVHRNALMDWLNAWGCRHLSKDNHKVASKSIVEWYRSNHATFFSDKMPLWRLRDQEIKAAANAYGSLRDEIGARHSRYGNQLEVRIGPTAASKILFAIRPKALMPWDDAMRKSFRCDDGSPESYARYLTTVRTITLRIEKLCRNKGFQIHDLPRTIGRAGSTVVELLNEYIWVITRRPSTKLPSSETLTQWASLG